MTNKELAIKYVGEREESYRKEISRMDNMELLLQCINEFGYETDAHDGGDGQVVIYTGYYIVDDELMTSEEYFKIQS